MPRCHKIGHNTNRCREVSPGKEICRKCGERDHNMESCNKEPCCAMCKAQNLVNRKDVTGSLACPIYRKTMKEGSTDHKNLVIVIYY
jgi:hypothetical protein